MTTFLLIRHGAHDLLGKVLAGRMPGVELNAQGRLEAEQLPARLLSWKVEAVYTSPMERTRETAAPLARRLSLEVLVNEAFQEIDFGDWTGCSFTNLEPEPEWRLWNSARSLAHPPRGETMQAVQLRFTAGLRALASEWPGKTVAIVSHGDPLKAALLHILGAPLDHIQRLELEPASLSVVAWQDEGAQVLLVNGR